MQFVKPDVNINFIGRRKIAFIVSAVMLTISIASLIFHGGPRLGIDFQGGTLIQVKFLAPVKIDAVKTGLKDINLDKSSVQEFGELEANEYLIRTDSSVMTSEGFTTDVQKALADSTGSEVDIRRVEMVGPQVGQDLREKALFAMFYADRKSVV